MTAYPAAQYRRAIRRARRRAGAGWQLPVPPWVVAVAIGAAVLGVPAAKVIPHLTSRPAATAPGSPARAALAAVSFARHQIGCPYQWGGTGPCTAGFDCSGLIMMAYESAGLANFPRTSELQWAGLRHVSSPHKGDLVFFAGSDGTTASPGHVGLVLGAHRMIDAYSTGYPIVAESFGLPSSREGLTDPVGYARPVPLIHITTAAASYTPSSWARALLHAAGFAATACNLGAITAWENAEGGNWANAARFNPLNDKRPAPGSSPAVGQVQAYASWGQGLDATSATLGGPDYGGIRATLTAGSNAQAVAAAVSASPWGTQPFSARCA